MASQQDDGRGTGQRSRGEGAFADWWSPLSRRQVGEAALKAAGVASALTLLGPLSPGSARADAPPPLVNDPAEPPLDMDSRALQRQMGWSVTVPAAPLALRDRAAVDSQASGSWRELLQPDALLSVYTPLQSSWRPFFRPTFLQSLAHPDLAAQMGPVLTPGMRAAYWRGKALGAELGRAEPAHDVLMVADLEGPEAVALGAALAGQVDLVLTFDNWPHPAGIVPAQQTLGALLFHAAKVAKKRARLQEHLPAPALFLLDRARLQPYEDASQAFDNRYLVELPAVAQLRSRGIRTVLYIVPDRQSLPELDDLNEAFVAYDAAGIEVAVLPLEDFFSGAMGVVQDPVYYGGLAGLGFGFFVNYTFFRARRPRRPGLTLRPPTARGQMPMRPGYRPAPRRGPARVASGVAVESSALGVVSPGRTRVLVSRGRVTAVRLGRSGSFTRAGLGGRG